MKLLVQVLSVVWAPVEELFVLKVGQLYPFPDLSHIYNTVFLSLCCVLLSHASNLKVVASWLHGSISWAFDSGGLSIKKSLSVIVGLTRVVL